MNTDDAIHFWERYRTAFIILGRFLTLFFGVFFNRFWEYNLWIKIIPKVQQQNSTPYFPKKCTQLLEKKSIVQHSIINILNTGEFLGLLMKLSHEKCNWMERYIQSIWDWGKWVNTEPVTRMYCSSRTCARNTIESYSSYIRCHLFHCCSIFCTASSSRNFNHYHRHIMYI